MTEIKIDEKLVCHLIAGQFPQWENLPIRPVAFSGWDNRTFHLGEEMLVRLPSRQDYAAQVEKEQRWLPKLAPFLPLPIPSPIAMGMPGYGYPWKWSVYRWLPGDSAAIAPINNLNDFAIYLAQFLNALRQIDSTGGPIAGPHSFYRGGSLAIYNAETREAIVALKNKIDTHMAIQVWEAALATEWQNASVWIHGDISVGNLLVQHGKLSAVIDFGQLAIGDPACDLAIAWTFFKNESREIFCKTLNLDSATWARARGWTLWKALIVAASITDANSKESKQCLQIIDEVMADYRRKE